MEYTSESLREFKVKYDQEQKRGGGDEGGFGGFGGFGGGGDAPAPQKPPPAEPKQVGLAFELDNSFSWEQ